MLPSREQLGQANRFIDQPTNLSIKMTDLSIKLTDLSIKLTDLSISRPLTTDN
jgi:hypothetical protein